MTETTENERKSVDEETEIAAENGDGAEAEETEENEVSDENEEGPMNDGEETPDETDDGTIPEDDGDTDDFPTDDDAEAEGFRLAAEEDYAYLYSRYPAMRAYPDLYAMPNVRRFAELREMGLTADEAYRAVTPRQAADSGKSHLRASVPRNRAPESTMMNMREMRAARALFPNLSKKEILSLYRRAKTENE